MRYIVKSSAVLALALAGSALVYGQAPQGTDQPQGQDHRQWRHHEPNPQFETKMLTKRLNLSAEQAAAVEPILAAQQEQMKALRPAPGTTPDFKAMHEQRKTIMTDTQQKLAGVLSTEQMQELARMHDHRGHGPHPPAPPTT